MSDVIRINSIEELKEKLRTIPPSGRHLVAGGTDWMIKYHGKLHDNSLVMDISSLDELHGIKEDSDYLYIGAMETMASIHSSRSVTGLASALADAASVMGSVQIRNRATLGGNLANASPAADTPSALAVLAAEAILLSCRGERIIPAEEVLAGPNKNTLGGDEFIKCFRIRVDREIISAFAKIGSRSEVSIARLNMAMAGHYNNGLFSNTRVYVGTLGSAAIRCYEAESALALPRQERCKALKDALAAFADKMIPGRSTLPYKRSAIQGLGEDVLSKLLRRAEGREE